jgi:signal transduction histidine kinase
VPNSAASDRRGSGLQNLSARLAAIGGQLTAQVNEDWFSVLAEAPLVPPVRHDRRPGAGARRRNRA